MSPPTTGFGIRARTPAASIKKFHGEDNCAVHSVRLEEASNVAIGLSGGWRKSTRRTIEQQH